MRGVIAYADDACHYALLVRNAETDRLEVGGPAPIF